MVRYLSMRINLYILWATLLDKCLAVMCYMKQLYVHVHQKSGLGDLWGMSELERHVIPVSNVGRLSRAVLNAFSVIMSTDGMWYSSSPHAGTDSSYCQRGRSLRITSSLTLAAFGRCRIDDDSTFMLQAWTCCLVAKMKSILDSDESKDRVLSRL